MPSRAGKGVTNRSPARPVFCVFMGNKYNWQMTILGITALLGLVLMSGCRAGDEEKEAPPPPPKQAAGWPKTFASGYGPDVVLKAPARHVVSLQPNIAEMLAAIGAGESVLAVDEYTDYPEAMAAKPKIGSILTPDYELVVSLKPDLIITSRGTPTEVLEKLRDLGLQVLGVDPQSVDEVLKTMKLFGEITGRTTEASQAVAGLTQRRDAIRELVANAMATDGRPRTVFVLSEEPLFVAGETSFVAELIKEAGGEPVIAVELGGEQQPWPQISKETLIATQPEVLVYPSLHGGEYGADNASTKLAQLRKDAAWSEMPAVQNGRVYVIDDDIVTIPGPRLISALEQMAEILHPTEG